MNAGDKLYDSASKIRIPYFPAFALECLPNRNSLVYGDLYRIGNEASTIFRGTLRYEGNLPLSFMHLNSSCFSLTLNMDWYHTAGFGGIMGTLARIGFFNTEATPVLKDETRPTYRTFLLSLLNHSTEDSEGLVVTEKWIADQILSLGFCQEKETAIKTAKTIV